MVWWLNSTIGNLIKILFLPFSSLSPWAAMIMISLLTALLMLLIYKKTSDQERIKKVKNRIKASFMEIRLFQHDLQTLLQSQKELFLANLRYLLLNLKPLLVMLVPIFLLLAQLNLWFGYKIPETGETFLLKVKFQKTVDLQRVRLELEAPEGVVVETPVLRILDEREANWRLRRIGQMSGPLIITVNGERYQKELPSGGRKLNRISTVRVKPNLWQELLYPGEKPLPADSLLNRVELLFKENRLLLGGIGFHWLVAYFLLSILLGLSLKGRFKVEI